MPLIQVDAPLEVENLDGSHRQLTQADITGPAGGMVTAIASTDLSGHRVVRTDSAGELFYASSDVPSHGPFWVTTGAASAGSPVACVSLGEMAEPSWSWIPGGALYLGLNGVLTQSPPMSGFVVQVAVALTATTIFVDSFVPILLA